MSFGFLAREVSVRFRADFPLVYHCVFRGEHMFCLLELEYWEYLYLSCNCYHSPRRAKQSTEIRASATGNAFTSMPVDAGPGLM